MRISARNRSKWLIGGIDEPLLSDRVGYSGLKRDLVSLGRGTPIVLVPGLAGGVGLVGPLARRLARDHRVIVTGLRGDRGPLGFSPALSIADHADDLASTLDELGLERPIVMGVSFGGAVALEYAVSHPQKLSGLALWGAEARFRPTLGTSIAQRVLDRYPLPTDSRFLNQFFNLLHGAKPEPGPLVDFIVDHCWRTDQSVVAHRIGMLQGFDVEDRLWQIDIPTLVMAGSNDVVVSARRQRGLAEAISGARFAELAGAGHVGFLTHRAVVADRVAQFVGRAHGLYC